jgi:hypothetical protein
MTPDYRPLHAFNTVPGDPQPTLRAQVALFFRRLVRPWRRKPCAVPADYPAAGTATTLLTHPATEPAGYPVLTDKFLSEVRAEQDALAVAYTRRDHPEVGRALTGRPGPDVLARVKTALLAPEGGGDQ